MNSKIEARKIALWIGLVTVCCLATVASAEWNEKVIYSFQGGTDGELPAGGVIFDGAGNSYGMTIYGGSTACPPGWCGTIYELSPPAQAGGAWTEKVLYVFKGHNNNDGSSPSGSLIADSAGNFYGVTGYGGNGPCVLFGTATGCGTVFELSPPKTKGGKWTEKVLYNFQGGNDGDLPTGPLVFDSVGDLYGATEFGGGKGTTCDSFYGGNCGTVFKLTPPKIKGGKWTEKVLHSFAGGKDGAVPNGGLLLDINDAIYGTTPIGGNQGCNFGHGEIGCGIVFKLLPSVEKGAPWTESVILRFTGGNGGAGPNGGLIFDTKGLLYGTAAGDGSRLNGVVFRLAQSKNGNWTETVLYAFTGGSDGTNPGVGLVFDRSGNLCGTALGGTAFGGVIFRLKQPIRGGSWLLTVLHNFTGAPDGAYPEARLTLGKAGSLYTATQGGGTGQACQGGCGTVSEISP